jgi:perosamine synthetase
MKEKIPWSGRAIDYSNEELDKILEIARTADPLTQGPYLTRFEEKAAKYYDYAVNHCFAVTNGASALELCAILCRLQKGDEVIIPGHTYCASAIPFGRQGAVLKWADLNPDDFLMDVDSIRPLITPKTKVIMAVHLYGKPCELDEIITLCKENNIILVEDCAQANGAEYKGKKVGTFGDFGMFSFHGQKNMTTFGEGGLLLVKDDETAKKVPGLRHNGHCSFEEPQSDYWIPAMINVDADIEGVWPYNFSLTEIQAAVGEMLYDRLDELNKKRHKMATKFRHELSKFPELQFQSLSDHISHVYHLLPARYQGSAYQKTNHDLIRMLYNDFGIKTVVQNNPLYRYPLFKKMGFGEANCPNTDAFFDNMISFPMHHWMSDEDFLYLIQSVKQALLILRN